MDGVIRACVIGVRARPLLTAVPFIRAQPSCEVSGRWPRAPITHLGTGSRLAKRYIITSWHRANRSAWRARLSAADIIPVFQLQKGVSWRHTQSGFTGGMRSRSRSDRNDLAQDQTPAARMLARVLKGRARAYALARKRADDLRAAGAPALINGEEITVREGGCSTSQPDRTLAGARRYLRAGSLQPIRQTGSITPTRISTSARRIPGLWGQRLASTLNARPCHTNKAQLAASSTVESMIVNARRSGMPAGRRTGTSSTDHRADGDMNRSQPRARTCGEREQRHGQVQMILMHGDTEHEIRVDDKGTERTEK